MPGLFVAGAAAVAGVATHISYFNKNEHAQYGVRYLQLTLVVFCTAVAGLMRIGEETFTAAVFDVASIEGSFLAGLFASLLVYRLILSPLNKFPGPFPARKLQRSSSLLLGDHEFMRRSVGISSLWYSTKVGPHMNAQHVLLDLHNKYGEFVRVGSSDLSITHPEAVNIIYGHGSKCMKGAWYVCTFLSSWSSAIGGSGFPHLDRANQRVKA
jgi:hypothetical protein